VSDLSSVEPCARCGSTQPQAARYCHRCGHDHLDLRADGRERAAHFVAAPEQRVRSVNLVTALLPLSSGKGVRTYEVALAIAIVIPVVAAAVGWVSFALVAAALAVPAVFTIYLYDVNQWEDQPVPVVLGCIVISGALGAAATWAVRRVLLDTGERGGFGDHAVDVRSVVVLGVVAPLVALVLSLAAPLWLASRPRFDDMIDGLTFGAVSGATLAAGETLMAHRDVFGVSSLRRGDAELWVSIIANAAVAKPVVYGAAVAIAAAGFSGIGAGYEGFGRRFATSAVIAAGGMVAYGTGVAMLDELDIDGTANAAFGLAWGIVVAAALVVVLRTQLHLGILEAALESARGRPSRHEVTADAHCGECELPLAPLALFCNGCGASVRATSKARRRHNSGRAA
jgi:ribosomal protein L40E